jgi:hypothetical protein
MTVLAEAPSPSGAAMMSRVIRPFATVLVALSPTALRMPGAALPARSITLASIRLRGAGPPNSTSSAYSAALPSAGRGAPGAGGVSEKSGGTTRGA